MAAVLTLPTPVLHSAALVEQAISHSAPAMASTLVTPRLSTIRSTADGMPPSWQQAAIDRASSCGNRLTASPGPQALEPTTAPATIASPTGSTTTPPAHITAGNTSPGITSHSPSRYRLSIQTTAQPGAPL